MDTNHFLIDLTKNYFAIHQLLIQKINIRARDKIGRKAEKKEKNIISKKIENHCLKMENSVLICIDSMLMKDFLITLKRTSLD